MTPTIHALLRYVHPSQKKQISMKKLKVTIGIPAYNEEKNIAGFIKNLLKQRTNLATVDKIIIVSDGSTDNTAAIVNKFKNHYIVLCERDKRKGKAARENEILKMSSGDITVLLDADIVINDTKFLDKLIAPVVAGRAEMTSSAIQPLSPRTFFEKTFFVSTKLKEILYLQFKNGDNVYTCYGPARAFARKFYKKLNFISSEGEDMFSYFSCLNLGYKFKNVPQALTYYRLPTNFADHCKQSTRYHYAKKHMNKYFDIKTVLAEQMIPLSIYTKAFIKALPVILKNPLCVVLYLLILAYTKTISENKYQKNDNWNVTTTKLVRGQL